jgi:hypothetical protein
MTALRKATQHVAGVVPHILFAAVLIAVIAGTAGRASRKLLWHDEIVTLAILQQPISELLPMLEAGIDLTPPLFHVVTEAGLYVPLPRLIALRSVSIAMFAVCLAAVYAFVKHRGDTWDALAAVTVLALSGAHTFAYEARAYAMLLASRRSRSCAGSVPRQRRWHVGTRWRIASRWPSVWLARCRRTTTQCSSLSRWASRSSHGSRDDAVSTGGSQPRLPPECCRCSHICP